MKHFKERTLGLQIDHRLFESTDEGEKQEPTFVATGSCSIGRHVEGTFHAGRIGR